MGSKNIWLKKTGFAGGLQEIEIILKSRVLEQKQAEMSSRKNERSMGFTAD